MLDLLNMLKITHTILAGKAVHVYTRFSTMEWLFTIKALYVRAFSFAVLLSSYHLKIKRVSGRDVDFAQLLQASVMPTISFDESLPHLDPPSAKHSTSIRLDPELLYARVTPTFVGFVRSFDGSAKTEKHGRFKVARGYCENYRNRSL